MSATHTYINSWIKKYFSSKEITIIDYGCGNGDLINYLDNKIIKKYTGYDVSADCIKVAKEKFSKNKFLFKKIIPEKPPQLGKENSIDLLILIGVAQYLSKHETEFLFRQANKILKNSGKLIISCSVNYPIYRFFNLYRFFTPNNYIDRKKFIKKASKFGLKLEFSQEKGLLIAPLFSNVFSLFFDAFDRVILKTRGKIGPTGTIARKIIEPLIKLEMKLPIDYGYTLYLIFKKV